MSKIQKLWGRLEAWGEEYAPAMLEDLRTGATEDETERLVSGVGRALPVAYLDSLRVHDGEVDNVLCKVFADMGTYLSIENVLQQMQGRGQVAAELETDLTGADVARQIEEDLIEVQGPVRPVLFHDGWIPIMDSNGDVFWALDFAPADGGIEGQVIEVYWEAASWKVIADSFAEFFEAYVGSLEAGDYDIVDGLPTRETEDDDDVDDEEPAGYAFFWLDTVAQEPGTEDSWEAPIPADLARQIQQDHVAILSELNKQRVVRVSDFSDVPWEFVVVDDRLQSAWLWEMIDPIGSLPEKLKGEMEQRMGAGESARAAMTAINEKLPKSERFQRLAQVDEPLPADVYLNAALAD